MTAPELFTTTTTPPYHVLSQTALLTKSMEKNLSWEPNSRSAGQEILRFFIEPEGSLPFSQEPATGHYPKPDDEFAPHGHTHPISLISILILFSHVRLTFPTDLFSPAFSD
jgi:hypothetical protein